MSTDTTNVQVLLTKPSQVPRNLKVVGERLYMLGFGQLITFPLEQPNLQVIVDPEAVGDPLGLDELHVYYNASPAEGPILRRVPIAGGPPEDILAAVLSQTASALFVDDRAIYWADGDRVMRLAK